MYTYLPKHEQGRDKGPYFSFHNNELFFSYTFLKNIEIALKLFSIFIFFKLNFTMNKNLIQLHQSHLNPKVLLFRSVQYIYFIKKFKNQMLFFNRLSFSCMNKISNYYVDLQPLYCLLDHKLCNDYLLT